MKVLLYILARYWKKHKKSAFLIMFSGILLTAVMCAVLLMFRDVYGTAMSDMLSDQGMYDMGIADVSETREFIEEVTADKKLKRGEVSVFGKMKTKGANQDFTYGTVDNNAGKMLNFRFEKGSLPKNGNEIAVTRTALNAFFWTGDVGDSIILNDKEYIVVGIINQKYDHRDLTGFDPLINDGITSMEIPYPLPMIFVADDDAPVEYTVLLFDGYNEEEFLELRGKYDAKFANGNYAEFYGAFNTILTEMLLELPMYGIDIKWTLIMSAITAAIAVLSVFTVLKGVFAERNSHIGLLRRTGMSKCSINQMYALECCIVIIVQTVLGILFGCVGYSAIYFYRVNMLGQFRVSAFSAELPADGKFPDPFLASFGFSVLITVSAYLLIILTSKYKSNGKVSKAKAGALYANLQAIFRQRGVTVIQTISLTLICFGSMLGYLYFTDDNKASVNNEINIYNDYGVSYMAGNFDLKKMGLEEYYSCTTPPMHGFGIDGAGMLVTVPDNRGRGISDEDISGLENITAIGKLEQTYIVSENERNAHVKPLHFTDDAQKSEVLAVSSEHLQNFFDKGQIGSKYLYSVQTDLADKGTIEKISEYVIEGEINIDRINSGEEIILVTTLSKPKFEAGEMLEIASLLGSESYGLADAASSVVRIGAIVRLPRSAMAEAASEGENALTFYAVNFYEGTINQSINFLTTATGAKALKIHNAAYYEVYSGEKLKANAFPTSAEMTCISSDKLKRDDFAAKTRRYGGIIMKAFLMIILGFAAYFGGIGLKLRTHAYEISALRAIGMPLSQIKRRIFYDNLKIPVISMAAASAGVITVQNVMKNEFEHIITMNSELDKTLAEIGFASEEYAVVQANGLNAISAIKKKFFLEKAMWAVDPIAPMLVIFAFICAVTIILTLLALRRHRKNIADMMNAERRRQ